MSHVMLRSPPEADDEASEEVISDQFIRLRRIRFAQKDISNRLLRPYTRIVRLVMSKGTHRQYNTDAQEFRPFAGLWRTQGDIPVILVDSKLPARQARFTSYAR